MRRNLATKHSPPSFRASAQKEGVLNFAANRAALTLALLGKIGMYHCFYCQRNIKDIDFKDAQILKRFLAVSAKIKSRKKTGLCATHQRKVTEAVKRARFLALMPYTKE